MSRKCCAYRCPNRATKYMLNKVEDLDAWFGGKANTDRAHPYCPTHWDRAYRKYWK